MIKSRIQTSDFLACVLFLWSKRWDLKVPLENIVASVAYAWRASDAPYFLPCRARFTSHRERSRSKPTTSSVGRGRAKHTVAKEKADASHLLFLLVAEVGFEPHDLRVMSPTSYQAALLRDMNFHPWWCR